MRLSLSLFLLILPGSSLAEGPDCGVNEHPSGGHCCRAGEEWVPAKRRCVCLEADVCGASAPKAEKAQRAEAKKVDRSDGWRQVGEALVQVLEFEGMVQQMAKFDSDYSRMSYAEQLGRAKRRFSCSQIARLMQTSAIDTSAVEIASHVYPHAIDPQNFFHLYGGLKYPAFSSGYLKERLGKQ